MSAMAPDLVRIVQFLRRNKIRATYKAVAGAANVPVRSMGTLLGPRSPLASWVVNGSTGEPTDYSEGDKDPDLKTTDEIITSEEDLIRRMKREPSQQP
jgi:hypothetical protein